MAAPIRLEGYALHAGVRTSVELARCEGPVVLGRGAMRAPLGSLRVTRADAGVAVTDGKGIDLDLVEHFLAALGGLGIRDGVAAVVDGPELPLLDGGAREFADALLSLGARGAAPSLVVARAGVLAFGASTYELEPASGVELRVDVDFEHPALGKQRVSWTGDPVDFRERIAGARTFGFLADAAALRAHGRARLCERTGEDARRAVRSALLTFDSQGALPELVPPEKDEPARHKLLDLIGDLALYGGPPQGRIRAYRPGHAATHHIAREALRAGLLCRR